MQAPEGAGGTIVCVCIQRRARGPYALPIQGGNAGRWEMLLQEVAEMSLSAAVVSLFVIVKQDVEGILPVCCNASGAT